MRLTTSLGCSEKETRARIKDGKETDQEITDRLYKSQSLHPISNMIIDIENDNINLDELFYQLTIKFGTFEVNILKIPIKFTESYLIEFGMPGVGKSFLSKNFDQIALENKNIFLNTHITDYRNKRNVYSSS